MWMRTREVLHQKRDLGKFGDSRKLNAALVLQDVAKDVLERLN